MSERKEDWISIKTPDGKDMIASPAYINKLLEKHRSDEKLSAWNHVTESLSKDVRELQNFVTELLIPTAREEIITFLRENPDVKTRDFGATGKWQTRLYYPAWWKAKNQLEEEGVIVSTSHGRGLNRTWNLKEEQKE